MAPFYFIEKLFDQHQYELIATDVYSQFYDFINDKTDTCIIVYDKSTGGSIGGMDLEDSIIEYCKDDKNCKQALKDDILNNLFQERIRIKDLIQNASLSDNIRAERIREQALGNIINYISSFNKTEWLNDKSYILEELKIFKKDIVSLRKLLHLEYPKKLPNITAKPILEIDSIDPLSFIDPHFMQAFKKAEKLALGHLGKFPSATRCAAFCEILYVKKYLKQTKTRIITMNNFDKLKYDTDIKIALSPGKVKKAERDKHKTRIIGELPPLNRCF